MVSIRALIIGLVFSFFIGAGEPFAVLHLHGSPLCADYSTGGAVFLFFILVFLINTALKKWAFRFSLQPGELVTVYIMMIVACAIPSWGFTMNLIGLLGGVYYYATPVNNWEQIIHPYLPRHLFPQSREAVWYLYEGIPRGMHIPWQEWVSPLGNWFLFILVFYFLSICLMVMLRRQWVEKEKLTYPLAELPREMVREKPPLYRSRLMWLGFCVPAVIYSINGLHSFFPVFPAVSLSRYVLIFNRTFTMPVNVMFEVIGLAFLMSLDVLLSVWFFSFLFIMASGFFNRIGFSIGPVQPYSDPAPQAIACLSLGALLVLSFSCLWTARLHLKQIFRRAVARSAEKEEEILSYPVAFWGFLTSFLFSFWWINRTGLKPLPSLFFLVMAILIFMGLSRIISQTGLAYYRAPVIPAVPTLDTFGSRFLGSTGLASLGMTFAWAADIRTLVMASTANGLKLATELKINCRRLLLAILGAIVVSLVSSAWCTLLLAYKYGGINLTSWQFSGLARFGMGWIEQFIRQPVGFGRAQAGFICLGGCLMFFLLLARNYVLGWPLSPMGLALGLPYPVWQTWFSVLIAWVVKVVIMKYGGVQVYHRAREFFLGLVLGAFTTAGFWLVVGFFTGHPGLYFTLG